MSARWLVAALAAGTAPLAPADDALLAAARKANRAGVEAVKTWRGKVDYTPKTVPDPGRAAGEFWRAGEQVRGRVEQAGQVVETLRAGAVHRTLTRDEARPGDIANFGEVHTGPTHPLPGDPWACGLFGFAVEGPKHTDLDRWLDDPRVKVTGAERVTVGGRPLVRVTAVSRQDVAEEFDLDPAVNHLVRTHRMRNDKPKRRDGPPAPLDYLAEVTEFREAKPGVFVPVAGKAAGTSEGRPVGYEWATADVAVNDPLPADALAGLRFPPGLRVVDNARQGVFRTDAAGEPGEWAVTPAGQPYYYEGRPPPDVAGAGFTNPVPADPWWASPVAVGGAAVLLVGGVLAGLLAVLRRRRPA